jgi:hypothetical protein
VVLAQNANLSGRVFDQSQLAVPGATVVIVERRTSLERSAQTNGWAPSSKASLSNNGTASLADSNVQHPRERSLAAGLT